MRAVICTTMLAGALSTPPAHAQGSLDELARYVVRLDKTERVNIGGLTYELYRRPLTAIQYTPHRRPWGTGFFVKREDALFLVTAAHVAAALVGSSIVIIAGKDDRPFEIQLSTFVKAPQEIRWTIGDDNADVAVLRIDQGQVAAHVLQLLHAIPFDGIIRQLAAPSRDRPVLVAGFPLGLGIGEHFSAIVKESKPVSGLLTLPRGDTQQAATMFLLDSPSIGGYSGAPLFHGPQPYSAPGGLLFPDAKYTCVGLVHGTVSDETGGKMAAVVPAHFVMRTLEKAAIATSR